MPGGGPGRLARGAARTLRTGFKTVVGAKDDCGIGPGEIKQSLEHHVVKSVGAFHDVFIDSKVLLSDPLQLGRVIGHEGVREMIDSIIVNSGEIPGLVLHQRGRDRVDRGVIA